MSRLEEILYSAEEHGKRTDLLKRVGEIRVNNPSMKLEDIYDIAYSDVMKTQYMDHLEECVICKGVLADIGHNPYPLNNGEGRCCDVCNIKYVIPARIYEMRESYIDNQ